MMTSLSYRLTPHTNTVLAAVVCGLAALCTPPARGQLTGQLGAHDPSTVIFDAGRYYYFATGDLLAVRSSTNLTSWTGEPAAFDTVPAWVNAAVPGYTGNSLWAPDVIELDGQFHLYYSASIWGTKLSAIGHATSPTLDPDAPDYGWTDRGMVINSNHTSPYNAIDPSLMLDDNTGRLWMTWGSFNNGIYVKELDPSTGQPIASGPGVNVAAPGPTPQIEGAAMVQRDGYYYLFVNWGGCCSGVDSTYNIRVGRSTSPTGPFLDRDGTNLLNGGGTVFLDDDGGKIGPGHFSLLNDNGQDKFSYHYYNGDVVGAPTFGLRDLYWTGDDWPSIAAVNPNWTGAARSDWSDSANWTNGIEPNGVGHVANFATQSTGTHTVTLPGGRTVGTVNFRGFSPYLIGDTAGPTLTLDDIVGESATLNVAEGSHTIAAPISALDNLGVNVTPINSTLTLDGPVTGSRLTKYGEGKLTLAGPGSVFSGNLFVKRGTLEVTGSVTAGAFSSVGQILGEDGVLSVRGSGSFTANADLNIADTGDAFTPATGTLYLSDQASVVVGAGGGFYVGSGFFANTRAQGTVFHSGGTLTVNRPADGSFIIGGRGSANANGVYNLSGGTVQANTNVFVGGLGEGTVNQDGGTFNAARNLSIGRFNGSTGNYTINSGTLNQTDAGGFLFVGEQGRGTLTLTGSGQVNASGTVRIGHTATGAGTINLNGGTLTTPSIVRGSGAAAVNFDGGVLRAGANQGAFLQGLTRADIRAGGAVIDTQSFSITVAQPLSHDPALGATPDGGLTKRGPGVLTLTAANTYTGDTSIENGTLALLREGAIAQSQNIIVHPGATFDLAGLGSAFILSDGQMLTNNSNATVVGDVTAGSGATVTGNGTFANNLTLQNGSSLLAGDTGSASAGQTLTVQGDVALWPGSMVVLGMADSGVNDLLTITGNLSAGGTLRVVLEAGAPSPQIGDAFDFLDFANAGGAFATLDLPALTGDLGWDTSNLLTTGILQVVSATLQGDLDGDGFVGITDLNLVLGSWNGFVRDGHPADPTGDNFVGIEDLNAVLGDWNKGIPPANQTNIPEPAGLTMLGLGAAACITRRRPA